MRRFHCACLAAALLALALTATATAAFPGRNGRIAASHDRGGIVVMNPDGTSARRLTTRGFSPAWSPDGLRIVFASSRRGTTQLYTMNFDGSGRTSLGSNADDYLPDWSPDSSNIVFMIVLEVGCVGVVV